MILKYFECKFHFEITSNGVPRYTPAFLRPKRRLNVLNKLKDSFNRQQNIGSEPCAVEDLDKVSNFSKS